ncbi:hypothetical protein PUN4_780055 [Paraburkholderia unamae]|nr:hypothetical protein PUN4_780055 [Paraburkholderia unamae]
MAINEPGSGLQSIALEGSLPVST